MPTSLKNKVWLFPSICCQWETKVGSFPCSYPSQILNQKKKAKENEAKGKKKKKTVPKHYSSESDSTVSVTIRKFGETKGGIELDLSEFDSIEELTAEAKSELRVSGSATLVRKNEVKITKLKLIKPGEVLYLRAKVRTRTSPPKGPLPPTPLQQSQDDVSD